MEGQVSVGQTHKERKAVSDTWTRRVSDCMSRCLREYAATEEHAKLELSQVNFLQDKDATIKLTTVCLE